ncbi:MAG: transcriptional regulator [Pseudonocardiales bacterium]|nr:MAG: transcriptional regulator [Pseudonocardiales bacterium]
MSIVDTVSYALAQACKAHRNLIAALLDVHGLHPGQEQVLMHLWQEDGLTHSELVERCRVEAPTVSKTVQRMEALGVVARQADERDARVSRVYLTEQGRQLREPIERLWEQLDAISMAGLSEHERVLLRRLLITVRGNLP